MEPWTNETGGWGPHGSRPATEPETTGRLLVYTETTRVKGGAGSTAGSLKTAETALTETIGLQVAHSSDWGADADLGDAIDEVASAGHGLMLDDLGITIFESHDEFHPRLAAAGHDAASPVVYSEPDRVVWAAGDYLTGFQDGVNTLADGLRSHDAPGAGVNALPGGAPYSDGGGFTWGLHAIGAPACPDLGAGARVAVFDTGVDADHADLTVSAAQSFVAGESADDGHGHGTHCCGTVAGQLSPATVPRFGVAPEAELYAGKVLDSRGRGSDANILAGIQWAVRHNCHVISMSLGAPVGPGSPYSRIYESVARNTLELDTIIVAAAGNASSRPGVVNPIGHPANCPSIIAVAALDQHLAPARFSDAGRVGQDHIAVSGPGVDVLSSVPGNGHRALSGTSMATPHVAGVAAVLIGREAVAGGELIMWLMLQIQGLTAPSVDVGAGLASVAVG